MKRTILFCIISLSVMLMIVGCCDCRKQAKNAKPLVGTTWQLVQLMGLEVAAEDDSFTLVLHDNGTLSTRGACNNGNSAYRMTTSREFTIGELATTKAMCRNMEQEQKFFDMLSKVTHYEIDRDMLLLLSNGSLVAILQAR